MDAERLYSSCGVRVASLWELAVVLIVTEVEIEVNYNSEPILMRRIF